MSKAEKKYLRHYLKAFQPRTYKKALQMLDLLQQNPEITQPELIERLYGDPFNKSFFHLKNRLWEKMLETLSLSINLSNNPDIQEDLPAFAFINLNKHLTSAIILKRKGLVEEAREILESCIEEAEAWDLPEIKLLALIQLRTISSCKKEILEHYTPDIQSTLQQFELDILSAGYMDELRVELPQPPRDEWTVRLGMQVDLLEQKLTKIYSPRAKYYYLMLKFIFLEAQKNSYESCKSILSQVIEILDKRKGLKSRNRLGIPYARMSEIELRLGNFEAAYEAAQKALDILPGNRKNHIVAAINGVYAGIYMGKLEEAKAICMYMRPIMEHKPEDIHTGWLAYLCSYIYFLEGDCKEAFAKMQAITQFQHAKNDWNPWLRIYEIQLCIDQQLLELAEARIEALRKHIAKYHLEGRIVGIYRILTQLEKQSFCFKQILVLESESLHQLCNGSSKWRRLWYEIIPFELWLYQRYHNRSLQEGLSRLTDINTLINQAIEDLV